MKDLKFGVEIEMKDITRDKASKIIAKYFGTRTQYLGQGYDTHGAFDKKSRMWKCMSDASVHDGNGGCEVVTPILEYDDINDLQELIRKFREAGGRIDGECGIHVHVGISRMSSKRIIILSNIIYKYEDIIWKALKIKRRRRTYCKKIDENFIKKLNEEKPLNKSSLENIWYGTQYSEHGRHEHYNKTRYHGYNLHALFTKGTVEFRMFNSTLHAGRVKAYVQFCLALVAKAKSLPLNTYEVSSTKLNMEEIDCYETFSKFLTDTLNLTGDEFKTCRHHMLFNLKPEENEVINNEVTISENN